jgi:hypothetical protein
LAGGDGPVSCTNKIHPDNHALILWIKKPPDIDVPFIVGSLGDGRLFFDIDDSPGSCVNKKHPDLNDCSGSCSNKIHTDIPSDKRRPMAACMDNYFSSAFFEVKLVMEKCTLNSVVEAVVMNGVTQEMRIKF